MVPRWQTYSAYKSPNDPCPVLETRRFIIPVNQFFTVQPRRLKQFAYREALRHGVLWPDLYSPYTGGTDS
ncbi:spore coat associated protein CotJA [Sulfoacidibacillus thermotolerans]|uniref:Spore coat protein CotJA n=1 Tax=Sulfoacidibacillus thermotolerans TaxID=1765684 RepID=A0A2U3DA46_SULT2|nr:spore coat associated protein CotJA [Sulfoacidibacillus thermotolerans]PWI58158.1 hypothetical protein BM613_04260 [Sulfoacidibacillus thermotolerans]